MSPEPRKQIGPELRKSGRMPARRVPVMLLYPFPGPFDYQAPPELDPRPGDVVLVPLSRREEIGVVWDGPAEGTVPDEKLRPVVAVLDTPPVLPPLRRFID